MDQQQRMPRGKGRPRNEPENATTQFAIRLTSADREGLKALADRDGSKLAPYIMTVLRAHMRDEGL